MAQDLKSVSLASISDKLKIHGRTALAADGKPEISPLALFWTGSGIEINIAAKELWIDLESHYSEMEPWILIRINGSLVSRMMIHEGRRKICVFRGFDEAETHNVKIIKETQAMSEDTEHCLLVHTLFVSSEAEFFPVKKASYNFEFIGDSITCGEGLAGARNEACWSSAWMSTANNYAFLVSEKLDADCRIIAQSGWGIYCGWDGRTDCSLPDYYTQVCGLASGEKNIRLGAAQQYQFEKWPADCVILSLGTNDACAFSERLTSDGKLNGSDVHAFKEASVSFLKQIRKNNPNSYIIWMYGLMNSELSDVIADCIALYKVQTSDERISYLSVQEMTAESAGSRTHPGPVAHTQVAKLLLAEIKKDLGI